VENYSLLGETREMESRGHEIEKGLTNGGKGKGGLIMYDRGMRRA